MLSAHCLPTVTGNGTPPQKDTICVARGQWSSNRGQNLRFYDGFRVFWLLFLGSPPHTHWSRASTSETLQTTDLKKQLIIRRYQECLPSDPSEKKSFCLVPAFARPFLHPGNDPDPLGPLTRRRSVPGGGLGRRERLLG